MERYRIRHLGPDDAARQLVSDLEAAGFQVDWQPPAERRDLPPGQVVALGIVASYPASAGEAVAEPHLQQVIERYLERFPRSKVDVQRDPRS